MASTLYLIEARAKDDYTCSSCNSLIPRGSFHFRHDPHPQARRHRDQRTSHWCRGCILAAVAAPQDLITGRLRVPAIRVTSLMGHKRDEPLLKPLRVEIVGIGQLLSQRLVHDPELVHRLTPTEFEELICDRLFAMGLEPRRVGAINRRDGGIDIVFWPRLKGAFPFLGAAQIKHRGDPARYEGPSTVREFAGAIADHPFNAGLLVTNTGFTPDAEWFAREHAKLIRLRGFTDIRRWVLADFADEAEWRELPSSIELCPGVIVRIR